MCNLVSCSNLPTAFPAKLYNIIDSVISLTSLRLMSGSSNSWQFSRWSNSNPTCRLTGARITSESSDTEIILVSSDEFTFELSFRPKIKFIASPFGFGQNIFSFSNFLKMYQIRPHVPVILMTMEIHFFGIYGIFLLCAVSNDMIA